MTSFLSYSFYISVNRFKIFVAQISEKNHHSINLPDPGEGVFGFSTWKRTCWIKQTPIAQGGAAHWSTPHLPQRHFSIDLAVWFSSRRSMSSD